jgi:hypothetical protein
MTSRLLRLRLWIGHFLLQYRNEGVCVNAQPLNDKVHAPLPSNVASAKLTRLSRIQSRYDCSHLSSTNTNIHGQTINTDTTISPRTMLSVWSHLPALRVTAQPYPSSLRTQCTESIIHTLKIWN